MLDYNLPGADIEIVEHVIRPDWDGPGMIRYDCWDMTPEQAVELAKTMPPKDENAVSCRAYDTIKRIWLDTGEPAWNPAVHKKP
jgi:hypothetical protein